VGRHADPWITLGVIASHTQRLTLGTAVTPMARRRPVKLAREILTLDALSEGRFVLGAGNGSWPDEFERLGEEGALRVRAEMLEEGLELIQSLCGDEPVDFQGRHYRAVTPGFGAPASGRRVPIWIGATWPRNRPFARAARYDGVIPMLDPFTDPIQPEHVRDMVDFVREHRESEEPFDVVVTYMGRDDSLERDRARALGFAEAGATWLLDVGIPDVDSLESLLERVRRGPPRASD
jgi:alkanesulfonate monooxygenase SsuD/methylene tetrahydromethanopterin reductase-like flavin-dependent oxidoreductase (luciferase family)